MPKTACLILEWIYTQLITTTTKKTRQQKQTKISTYNNNIIPTKKQQLANKLPTITTNEEKNNNNKNINLRSVWGQYINQCTVIKSFSRKNEKNEWFKRNIQQLPSTDKTYPLIRAYQLVWNLCAVASQRVCRSADSLSNTSMLIMPGFSNDKMMRIWKVLWVYCHCCHEIEQPDVLLTTGVYCIPSLVGIPCPCT